MPKTIILNETYSFTIEIPNRRELQQIALNHLSYIKFEDFLRLYKDNTKEPFSFLVNDTNLSLDNPLRVNKSLFKK